MHRPVVTKSRTLTVNSNGSSVTNIGLECPSYLVAELLPLDGLGVIPEALEPLGLRWRATAPASAASPLC